jgi:hypothetical protein
MTRGSPRQRHKAENRSRSTTTIIIITTITAITALFRGLTGIVITTIITITTTTTTIITAASAFIFARGTVRERMDESSRRTVWWGWEDSNSQPNGYERSDVISRGSSLREWLMRAPATVTSQTSMY